MKSILRWGATLGLIGTTLFGPSLAGMNRAIALPQEDILDKLRMVPVFTITDAQGAPLIASYPNSQQGGDSSSVAGVFISRQDALEFIENLETRNPDLADEVRVTPISLAEIYQLTYSSESPSLRVSYVPTQEQVEAAVATLQADGEQVEQFRGVPLFIASGSDEQGYLTIQRGDRQFIPLFFDKEQLLTMVDRFKQQQPDLTVEVEVVQLEGVLQALRQGDEPQLDRLVLIPSRESLQFVRSLQQSGNSDAPQPQLGN